MALLVIASLGEAVDQASGFAVHIGLEIRQGLFAPWALGLAQEQKNGQGAKATEIAGEVGTEFEIADTHVADLEDGLRQASEAVDHVAYSRYAASQDIIKACGGCLEIQATLKEIQRRITERKAKRR
jgi:hypothetical protein